GEEREAKRVVGLEGKAREIRLLAFQRTYPALLRHYDGDRLALDERFLDCRDVVLGRLRKLRTALAKRRLRSEFVAEPGDLFGNLLPLLVFRGEQCLDALQLRLEVLLL